MNPSQWYVLAIIIALAIIATVTLFIRKDKKGKPMTVLASSSIILVLGGVFFLENGLIGYILMTAGGILAVVDMVMKGKGK